MRPIILATDYGVSGPYVGQLKSAIYNIVPDTKVIDLIHDLPACNPKASSYLLANLIEPIPNNSIVIGVVDPGVGSDREAIVIEAEGLTFIGPNNGLFAITLKKLDFLKVSKIILSEAPISKTFHGRDVFAPYAANLAKNIILPSKDIGLNEFIGADWQDELLEVIYVDNFGNAISGLSLNPNKLDKNKKYLINNYELEYKDAFYKSKKKNECFWYCNSNNLLEISANQQSAKEILNIDIGSKFEII